jgi:hypothetical protein
MDKYQDPENKRKTINQILGGIRKRRAKAKTEVEARKKANDLEAKTRAKADEKKHKARAKADKARAKKAKSEDLAIEDDGTIGRDIGPAPSILTGEIYFGPVVRMEKEAVKSGDDLEQLTAEEPSNLNLVARERLERQISDLISKANQSIKERNRSTRDALDILEMARTTAYTEPMGEVAVTIHEAARRLSDLEPEFSNTANTLGNLASEIQQSEQLREVSK